MFLEIGPQRISSSNGQKYLCSDSQGAWLPSLTGGGDDWRSVAESWATLFVRGYNVDGASFDRPYPRRRIPLPTYPFERDRFWFDMVAGNVQERSKAAQSEARRGTGLLGSRVLSPIPQTLFESRYSVALLPWLRDHRFYDSVIVAGAAYLSMAIAGANEVFKEGVVLVFADVAFPQAMILPMDSVRIVQLIFSPQELERFSFQIVSTDETEKDRSGNGQIIWKLHATGRAETGPVQPALESESLPLASIWNQEWESLSADEYYRVGLECGMQAGPSFKWIARLWRGHGEALAELVEPQGIGGNAEMTPVHPGVIDSCFQLLAACLPPDVYPPPRGEIPVVVQVDRFRWMRRPITARAWAHLRLQSPEPGSSRNRFTADFKLFDEEGGLLIDAIGLHIQLVRHQELLRRETEQSRSWIHEIEWQPKPIPGVPDTTLSRGSWLILADRAGVGVALAAALSAEGECCFVAFPDKAFRVLGEGQYGVDPDEPGDFHRLVNQVSLAGACRGVIHLWSTDLDGTDEAMSDSLEKAVANSLGSVLSLIKALVMTAWQEPPRLWLVTRGAQGAEAGGNLVQAPLWGLGNVLALEHPELRCARVDLDPSQAAMQEDLLLGEIRSADRDDQVVYRGGTRYVPRLVPGVPVVVSYPDDALPVPQENPTLFRPDATYLITGGLRGLGLLVARWMVAEGARHLVLIGRNCPDPAAVATLLDLERTGAKVCVATVDVAQYDLIDDLVSHIDSSLPLRGIVHAAGILDDGALLQQDVDRLSAVLAPKARGAWNLHVRTQSLPLDFFILFSSVASIIGSPGQGSYAAANAFLDALARERARQGRPAQSLNWGPWSGSEGMAARVGEQAKRRWAQVGVDLIGPNQGLEILKQMLQRGSAQAVVLPVDWPKFLMEFEVDEEPPLLSVLARLYRPAADTRSSSCAMRIYLDDVASDERAAFLIDHLRLEALKVLGLPRSHPLDPKLPLNELGLDSIMAIEFTNNLQESLGCNLPATLLYEHPTIEGLSEYLLRECSSWERTREAP